jgi:hypothetical protein
MAIYDYDNQIIGEQLTPPVLRTTKQLAWINTLTAAIQNLWSLIFEDYRVGSVYPDYGFFTQYYVGDRVLFVDKSIYECISNSLNISCLDTTKWVKVNDNFIGSDERVKYNSQLIVLEYALNNWFLNLTATDQIFIATNNITSNLFLMGQTGTYSSTMANSSVFSAYFMPNVASYPTQYNFTINVPLALFTTLGTDNTNRENTIRIFADKYVLSGITYNVTTYP